MRLDCSIFRFDPFYLELHVPVDLAARCSAVVRHHRIRPPFLRWQAKWIIRLDQDLASFRCSAWRRHRHPPRLSIVRACSMVIVITAPSGVLGILERKRLIYRIHCRIILHRTLMNVITINPSTIGGDSPQKSINSPTVPWWWSDEGAAAALAAAVALSHHHVDWHRRRHRRLGLHTTTTSTRCKQTAVPIPHKIVHSHHDDDTRW